MLSLVFFSISSCWKSEEKQNSNEQVIAKAYQYRLNKKEFENSFNWPDDPRDSSSVAETYIDQWIIDKVMLHNAELRLSPEDKRQIRSRVAEYKNTLYINAFEELMIQERLDTLITEKQIQKYYQTHKDQFLVQGLIVKLMYLKLPIDAPDINKVKRWYLLKDQKDSIALDNYAKHYALNYYFDDNSWLYLEDVKEEVPIKMTGKEIRKLPYTSVIQDTSNYFFIHIFDLLEKDAVSPIEIEKDKIKKAILTQRIHLLRKQIKKELLESAYDNNAIEK